MPDSRKPLAGTKPLGLFFMHIVPLFNVVSLLLAWIQCAKGSQCKETVIDDFRRKSCHDEHCLNKEAFNVPSHDDKDPRLRRNKGSLIHSCSGIRQMREHCWTWATVDTSLWCLSQW